MQVAYFQQMARAGDAAQRQHARDLMREAGFSDAEITAHYVDATMHMDHLPDDFTPDLDLIETKREAAKPHPFECTCPSCWT